jgi:hypothetical protein
VTAKPRRAFEQRRHGGLCILVLSYSRTFPLETLSKGAQILVPPLKMRVFPKLQQLLAGFYSENALFSLSLRHITGDE